MTVRETSGKPSITILIKNKEIENKNTMLLFGGNRNKDEEEYGKKIRKEYGTSYTLSVLSAK